ncbi:non-ribosomal peptide synthetase [Micromonospora sp. HUAS LYJ1]|uniref:non-ribosomal peptide synthetase n=1 Tax=Micromonospora sp. HUAS LYJ1 TaxID=3061626 RepID=UPI002670FEC2|nr:non-ribosomal peptide synthetase [Micromonospora sp. HUAS LYJ1]WKU02942.1 non-ribosomal peptide synthetase [Micromonospora sp. HUAS LYJ1]
MAPDPTAARLTALFDTQVTLRPDEVALRHQGRDVTFEELDRWSGQLAHQLDAAGIRAGDLVALAVDRSPAMVAAVLAVIRVGAGYLSLDQDTPVRRQRTMTRLARPVCLLARPHLDRLPTLDVPRVLVGEPPTGPVPRWTSTSGGDDPAVFQVAPTSGTTGAPRLVRIGYRSVLNRLEWMWRDHPFPPDATVAVQKSPSLVAAPWEMLGGLLQGVRSVVLAREEVLDPALFAEAITAEGITHLYLTPHLIAGLLDQAERAGGLAHRMRLVTSGADTLSPELVRRFHATLPGVRLLNLYGMTETASNTAAYDTALLPATATRVPVGRPVANATITVRDRALRPVPPGVTGEVCVSGPPLALGYLDDDETTAARFVRPPDGPVLFRTGDQGRWQPGGLLEITGRTDNQVKIRGYRVELEEVELALARIAPVTAAGACVVTQDGEPVLSAGLTAEDDLDVAAVRVQLRDQLPDYLVPARLVPVPALPRGRNGKLDRRALADLIVRATAATGPARTYRPASRAEEIAVRCWHEVLGAPPEDAKQNFFDAGGHSLLAVRLAARLQAVSGTPVSLRALLEDPTVAGVAGILTPGDEP